MEVLFFTEFSKRKNSTKVPNDELAIVKNVRLKSTTDKMNPTFLLNGTEDYVYCKAWDMYYFVHRIGYDIDGAQMVYCNLDVLATFKERILNTKAFVKYSSTYYNTRIIDARIPRLTDTAIRHNTYPSVFDDENLDNQNVIFVTIGGENSQTAYYGGYNAYQFTETGWNDLCAKLCDDTLINDIKKFFTDAASGLISTRRMPIKTSALPIGPVSSINVGRASISYPAHELTKRYIHPDPIEMEIPLYRTDFNEWSPYRRLKLYIPFIGTVDIPTDLFHDKTIILDYTIDLITGLMEINLCSHSLNNKLMTFSTEVGGQLPTSVNNVNLLKVASNGVNAIGAVATGNPIGALEQAANAVSTGLTDNISSKGIFGGGRSEFLGTDFILYAIDWQPVFNANNADYIALHGRPCYQVTSLENLTGYVETVGFDIDMSALDVIKDMINNYLNSGIYIE